MLLETVRELKDLGIGVWFEEQNIDTLSTDGELMLTILAGFAQEESRSASENCKWRIRGEYKKGRPMNPFIVYGYEVNNGKLTVIPEEAEVVRMIFNDYISGLGKNAIVKKLLRLGVPTKLGGRWTENGIYGILQNEKYLGDICLQKGYISDHITKRLKKNNGELPKYYIEDSHEAIIDDNTFEAVQIEMARRAASVKCGKERPISEFCGILRCGMCGAAFQRKLSASGTKYEKLVWACRTFIYRGKAACGAKRISEDILKAKCAEVLGLSDYNPAIFKEKVAAITVPNDGVLILSLRMAPIVRSHGRIPLAGIVGQIR